MLIYLANAKCIMTVRTHEIRLSIDVSIGLVFNDRRKDANPGVKAIDVDGIVCGICFGYFFA